MAFGSFSWDFTLLPLDDQSTIQNSYGSGGGSGSTIQSSLPPSSPPILNSVIVAIPPPLPTSGNPVPQIEAVRADQQDSQTEFGIQSTPVLMTILSSIQQAEILAEYLGRPFPSFFFTGFRINLARFGSADRDALAEIEIGDQLRVSKRILGVANPVEQTLFVEGIEHEITPNNHMITIFASPAVLWEPFELDVNELDDPLYGLG